MVPYIVAAAVWVLLVAIMVGTANGRAALARILSRLRTPFTRRPAAAPPAHRATRADRKEVS